jgi:hypothetical protein
MTTTAPVRGTQPVRRQSGEEASSSILGTLLDEAETSLMRLRFEMGDIHNPVHERPPMTRFHPIPYSENQLPSNLKSALRKIGRQLERGYNFVERALLIFQSTAKEIEELTDAIAPRLTRPIPSPPLPGLQVRKISILPHNRQYKKVTIDDYKPFLLPVILANVLALLARDQETARETKDAHADQLVCFKPIEELLEACGKKGDCFATKAFINRISKIRKHFRRNGMEPLLIETKPRACEYRFRILRAPGDGQTNT